MISLKFSITYLFIIVAIAIVSVACNPLKTVPANDALYTGAKVKLTNSSAPKKQNKVIEADLNALTRPKPNSKLLGIRFKLGLYNMSGDGKGFFKKILRKWGEPPVLLSQVSLIRNTELLQNTLENKGFFHAKVTGDTIVKKRFAHAEYIANAGVQYKINEVTFPADSSVMSQAIRSISNKSILKKGDPFILDVVKGERVRIDVALKERGYFYFAPEDLTVLVDSTVGSNLANLYVTVKKEMPLDEQQPYSINNVYIYSNYNLNTAARDTVKADSVFYKGYYVIDRKKMFKPLLFEQMMRFHPGQLYNRTDHNLSLSRLINLGTFKFVKNRFEPVPDSFKLNTYYYLTPLPKKSISAEIGALTKSNNATGSEVTVRWKNRNTFRAAELLSINAYFGTEVQYSGQYSGFNTLRYGAEANIAFPRFVIPLFKFNTAGSFVPRTTLKVGYDILQRPKLYMLNSYRGEFGYVWKEDARKEHQFNPLSVNYVQPSNISDSFQKSIHDNPVLAHTVEQQFILGSNYNFNYNQLVNKEKNAGGLYFNGLLDLSGNIAGLITGANAKAGKIYKVFGSRFSQYIKAEFDTRYYVKVGMNDQWANRIIVGLGFPYGNSTQMPFVKQYFVGGNNSLRGFRSRSVGPGTYPGGQIPTASGFYPDITGDFKLELNTEYRMKLASIFYGAAFIDAGNVWLYNEDTLQVGAKLTNKFLGELAVDAGIGLRIDITILLLRIDVAIPLRYPYTMANQSKSAVFNLAIGLPF